MTDNAFLELAAPGIAQLKPYVPGKPIAQLERELGIQDSIKLASNENPLGCSHKAKQAIQVELGEVSRYPDGGGFELRRVLAEKHALDPACITLGKAEDSPGKKLRTRPRCDAGHGRGKDPGGVDCEPQ